MDVLNRVGDPVGDEIKNGETYKGYSVFSDVCMLGYGDFALLDHNRGRVFAYNSVGELLYEFGGPGDVSGAIRNGTAIGFYNDRFYILDTAKTQVTVFELTEYGKLFGGVAKARQEIDFETEKSLWNQILSRNANCLPRWIMERAKEKNGQTLTPDAANLIAERTEGNLLATSQEIQKLALLVNKPEIDVSDVLDAVSDVSRFDQESLFLAMLEGDAGQVSKIIDSLQGENVQIPSFLWMLTDVVRNLLLLNRGLAARTFGLSEAHRSALNRAARRANPKLLELMLHRLSDVDRMSKGLFVESSDGDAWQELKAVCLMLSLKRK